MARDLTSRAARALVAAAVLVAGVSLLRAPARAAVAPPDSAASAPAATAAAASSSSPPTETAPADSSSAPPAAPASAPADSAAETRTRVVPRDVTPPPHVDRRESRADSAAAAARPRTAPFKVMMRSALVPGWGQLYNHQPLKAALVIGVEGFFVAKTIHELDLQNRSLQQAADAEAVGDLAAQDAATLEADLHRNRKISWIWWGVAAHLLSMADAYVDAHLSTFNRDFEFREAGRRAGAPELRLGYRVRF
ncbi:MAG: DUF5683 domain-containing protein [Hyphomicrobiales bacterium]